MAAVTPVIAVVVATEAMGTGGPTLLLLLRPLLQRWRPRSRPRKSQVTVVRLTAIVAVMVTVMATKSASITRKLNSEQQSDKSDKTLVLY